MVKVFRYLTVSVAATHRYSIKKLLWSTSQDSQKNAATLLWKDTYSRERFNNFQARHFMKHAKYAKHVILWSTPSTPIFEAHQAYDLMKDTKHAILWSTLARWARDQDKHVKHAKYANTQVCHLADSFILRRNKQPIEAAVRMFSKIDVLKNFTNFTRKHLCWSHFLIKLQALYDSNTGVFVWSLWNF